MATMRATEAVNFLPASKTYNFK